MYKKSSIFLILVLLLVLSLACALGGGASSDATQPPEPVHPIEEEASPIPEEYEGETVPQTAGFEGDFPIPDDVDAGSVMDLGDGAINFQTSLSLSDAVSFYRSAFADLGYTEREINTSIEDAAFSMVFDGHSSGKAIVIQGVNLGEAVNINIRFEDI